MKTRKLLSVLSALAILAGVLTVFPVLPGAADTADFTISDNGVYKMDKALTSAPLTLEAEIKFPTTGTGRLGVLLGNWCYPVGAFADYDVNASGNPRLYWGKSSSNNEALTFTDVNVFTGEWLHLAIVIDVANTQVHCYVNGELKQSLTTKYTEAIVCSNAFAVGNNIRQGNGYNFRGAIKSLALYNDVRTATEVAADVSAYGTDGLMTHYDMEGLTEGDTLTDTVSGNNAVWEQKWLDTKDAMGDYDYSIAVIGDPQTVTLRYPSSLPKIYQYIADTAVEKKLAHVFTMGDLTDTFAGVEKEWVAITDAMDILNGVVPHSMLRGNHDDETWYDQYITEERYNDGVVTMDGTMKNYYREINMGGTDYLTVTLDWRPSVDEQAWACDVIEAHPDHRVILTTHSFTDSTGNINNEGQEGDGMDIWTRIASKYPNIVLVLSGHSGSENIVMRKATGVNGNTVTHVLVDQQDVDQPIDGGTGLIAYFYFSNGGKDVEVEFYSPLRDQYYKPCNQFSFELDIPWDETVPALKAVEDARVAASADTSILRFLGGDIAMEATATDDGYKYALDVRPNDGYTFKEENFYVVDVNGQKITPALEADGYYYVETTGGGTVYASFIKGVELPDESIEFAADFSELAALVPSTSYAGGSYSSTADDAEINAWVDEKFGLFFNQESNIHYEMAHLGQATNELKSESGYTGNMQWQIRESGAVGMTVAGTSGQLMRKHLALTAKTADGSYAQMGSFEAEVVFNKAGKNAKVGGVYVSFHEKSPGRAHFNSNNGLPITSTTGNMVAVCNTPAAYAYGGYVDTVSVIAGIERTTDTRIAEVSTTGTWDTAVDYKLYVKVLGTTLTWSVTNLSTTEVVASGTDEIAAGSGTVSVGVASGEHEIKSVKVNSLDHVLSFHGGTVTVDAAATDNGYRYTLNVQAEEEYALDEDNLYVEDANGEKVTLTAGEDGVYYAETSGGGKVFASFLKIPKETKKFTADFSELAALVPDASYTNGVYTSTADDTEINAWVNEKFGLFFSQEYSNYYEMAHLGQPTDELKSETGYTGNMQWKITQNSGISMTVAGKSGQLMRKQLTLTAKYPNGEYAALSNFEAEVVFNKAGKNAKVGGVFVSFHEKSPGRVNFDNSITPTSNTGDLMIVSNALATYAYEGYGDKIAVYAGIYDVANCRNAELVTDATWETSTDYKLYMKVVDTTLTWSVTNLSTQEVVASGSDEITAGSGTISVGVASGEHELKSFTVTELDENGDAVDFGTTNFDWTVRNLIPYSGSKYTTGGNAWYTFGLNDTEDAATVRAALNKNFALYYNSEGTYSTIEPGANTVSSTQTADIAGFNAVYANRWLQRTVGSPDGTQNFRLISSLVPKDVYGNEMQTRNFETNFEIRFESSTEHIHTAILGFRQQTPGKFVDGYWDINQEQAFVAISRQGITIAGGEGIISNMAKDPDTGAQLHQSAEGDMYNEDAIKFNDTTNAAVKTAVDALPQNTDVYVKVVEDTVIVKIMSDDQSTVYFDNSDNPATFNYDIAGYIAYGMAGSNTISYGDISLTRLADVEEEEQADNTAVVDGNVITVKAGEGYQLKAGSLIVTDANGNTFVPERVGYRNGGDASQYTIPADAVAPCTVAAEFYQPGTETGYNMGLIGTSVHTEDSGLRFVHRLNIDKDGNMLYNGENVAIKEYGLLLASGAVLKNAEDLDIETADESAHVHQFAWPETDKYYDLCDEYVDIAIHVKNIATYNGQDTDLITRTYIILEDDTVVYGDVAVSTYNQAAGLA